MKENRDYSYGIVPIYTQEDGSLLFLLVQHVAGHWSFPKGHAEDGERPIDAARRELKEETGISQCSVDTERTFSESYTVTPDTSNHVTKHVEKTVSYFIAHVPTKNVSITDSPDEITDFVWLTVAEAREKITFTEARRLLDEVYHYLNNS